MIGATLKTKTRIRTGTVISLLLGLAILGLAITMQNDDVAPAFYLFAFWPLCLAVILGILGRKQFHAELQPDSIRVFTPTTEEIPYSSIRAVQKEPSAIGNYPLYLHHAHGILKIPARVGVRTSELLAFLVGHIPPGELDDLPEELKQYFYSQNAKFGPDRVFAFIPRRMEARSDHGEFGRALGLSCALTGFFWMIMGLILHDKRFNGQSWASFGAFFLIIGLILYWMFHKQRAMPGGQKKWQYSGLVISPIGLALIQSKTQGEMKWAELKHLIYPTKKAFLDVDAISRVGNIRLDFGGGGIEILDVYCHPLDTIHERIKGYWQG